MNKFFVLALVAVSCTFVAANPLDGDELASSAVNPSDDEEVARLDDTTRAFSDFCISTRGLIFDDIKSTSNGVSSRLFNTLFNTAEQIGTEAMTLQKTATSAVADQIRNPEASFENDGSEISAIRTLVQEERTVPKTFLAGFYNVLRMTANSVSQNLMTKFNDIKNNFGVSNLTNFLASTCQRVANYDELIKSEFNKYKSALVADQPSAASVKLEDVQCLTMRRVIRLDGICRLAIAAKDPFMKVAQLKPMSN